MESTNAIATLSATARRLTRGFIKTLGMIVVGIAVLVGGGFLCVMKATEGPEKAVQEFLAAAGRGDYAVAHDYFSAPLKQEQPFESFRAMAEANRTLFKIKDTTFNERSRGTNGASFKGNVALESGTEVPCHFTLVEENDAWKLLGYGIGAGS